MAHCYYHALSSVRKWGGAVDDYLPLHQWFDQSKAILADPRHRALRHHAEGIFMLESLFGATIVNADGSVEYADEIVLVLLDMTMPELDGRGARDAREARLVRIAPGLPLEPVEGLPAKPERDDVRSG